MFRILKPGGRCIAHVPNAEGLFGMRIRYGDMTHENAFTPKSAHQLFTTIGFEKVECHEDRPVIHNVKSLVRRIIWDVFTLVPRLLLTAETGGNAICVIAEHANCRRKMMRCIQGLLHVSLAGQLSWGNKRPDFFTF